MRELKQKNRLNKILFSRPVFAICLVVVVMYSVSLYKIYTRSRQASLRNDLVKEEIKDMEGRKNDLGANIGKLRTDEGIEKELRKKFQVKKPGEDYVIIIDKNEEEEGKDLSSEVLAKEESFFKKVWELIKF
ncbi:hypothetical protein ACFLZC_00405 [Patescibacteria group bacterium]